MSWRCTPASNLIHGSRSSIIPGEPGNQIIGDIDKVGVGKTAILVSSHMNFIPYERLHKRGMEN